MARKHITNSFGIHAQIFICIYVYLKINLYSYRLFFNLILILLLVAVTLRLRERTPQTTKLRNNLRSLQFLIGSKLRASLMTETHVGTKRLTILSHRIAREKGRGSVEATGSRLELQSRERSDE